MGQTGSTAFCLHCCQVQGCESEKRRVCMSMTWIWTTVSSTFAVRFGMGGSCHQRRGTPLGRSILTLGLLTFCGSTSESRKLAVCLRHGTALQSQETLFSQ